jgi:ankyrin repeat protein
MAACRYNDHALIVGMLLEQGAAVDADMDEALVWASSHGHTDSVALLLEHGADATALKVSVLLKASAYPATLELLLTHGACMREEEMLQAREESAGAELAAMDTPIGHPDPSTSEIPSGYLTTRDSDPFDFPRR